MKDGNTSVKRWRVDGKAFGATVIHIAVAHSEVVSLEEHSKAGFVLEFLILCRLGLGLLGVENRLADWLLDGIDDEFARFNPKYLDLVEARLACYFKVIENAHNVSDWMHRVVDDWARRVDVPTNVAPWGYEAFLGILNLFLQQIGSESAPVQ